MFGCLAYVGKI
jgi:hypothetical protein